MPEPNDQSVTVWLGQLQAGDEQAAQLLWQRYWGRLVELARRRTVGRQRVADGEDVAQEAFDSFFRAARVGRFPQLHDRNDLWQLLVKIADNKQQDQRKSERRQKRGSGQVRGESVFATPGDKSAGGLDGFKGVELTPEFAAQAREECERLLGLLDELSLRQVALLKLQGYSHEEIALRIGCAVDTVGRKLRTIRSKWES